MERVTTREISLVSEAMTTAVATVAPGMTVEAARRRAEESGAHHQLVLDEGTLVGILCRCDLDEAEPGSEVSDCMSVPVMTIHPGASLAAAIATMDDFEVGCLPVMAGGLVMGLISGEELARAGAGAPRSAGRCRCHRRAGPSRPH